MQITSTGTLLKLTFAYHPAIVERIRTIPGAMFDGDAKCWFVPALYLSWCEALFPKASFEYDCWIAESEAQWRWAEQNVRIFERSGARFRVTEDDIVLVEGDCVSPVTADMFCERSAWVAPYLAAQGEKTGVGGAIGIVDARLYPETVVEPSEQDERMATVIHGGRAKPFMGIVQGDLFDGSVR